MLLGEEQRWLMTFSFFLFSLLLSFRMPILPSLILLHLSISLTAWMVSFACGNLRLIHLERPATVRVRIHLGRKECQLLCLNDWQSPCNYSYTSWYPVCFSLLPPTGIHPGCLYLQVSPSLEQRRELLKPCFDSPFFLGKQVSSPLWYLFTEALLKQKDGCVW